MSNLSHRAREWLFAPDGKHLLMSKDDLVASLTSLLESVRREAMLEAEQTMQKHRRKQSAGRCCDNCNCLAFHHSAEAIRTLAAQKKDMGT